jgi:phosphate starvation-inducible PhoH-like protein
MKMFLTRLGTRSKAVVTGDITQVDLPPEQPSGLIEVRSVLTEIEGLAFCYLTERDVVRNSLVQRIIQAYERHDNGTGVDDSLPEVAGLQSESPTDK